MKNVNKKNELNNGIALIKNNKKNSHNNTNSKKVRNNTIDKKERNRRRYLNQQKSYNENIKKKKTNINKLDVNEKKVDVVKNSKIEKNKKPSKYVEKKKIETKKNDSVKSSSLSKVQKKINKSINDLKIASVETYNTVKEKSSDSLIPLGKSSFEKKKRIIRYLKEAIFYAIIMTLLYLLCYVIFDYFSLLRLFDIKIFNVVVTMLISLIMNFIAAFIIDYIVTEIWTKFRRKKQEGEHNGNSGINGR